MASIDAGFLLLNPELTWYVGLSGALHGVMAAGTLAHLRRREPGAGILAVFLGGETRVRASNRVSCPTVPSSAGGPVVVDAHLYGAIRALDLPRAAWRGCAGRYNFAQQATRQIMALAFVFPGQGSQSVGMLSSPAAQAATDWFCRSE